MNYSLRDQNATGNYYDYNNTEESYEHIEGIASDLGRIILKSIIFITCCIGVMGNGYIIWLLGFQIKRNPFTTFVLNLAIADFGFLITIVMYCANFVGDITSRFIFNIISAFFSHTMYINSHFLLTAISIDRCVSVLFPIWHRCSRPSHLSCTVCVLLWILSFFLGGILRIIELIGLFRDMFIVPFLVSAILCFPLITISTVILFFKVCLKSKQKKQGRLLMMILITLLCFLILAFPLNVFVVIMNFFPINDYSTLPYWESCIILSSCLNSSINPVIYFLVGRKKVRQSKESLKVILQNVFKEGEAIGGR